jgi:hypothetical protein
MEHAANVNSYKSSSVKNNCKDEDQSTGQIKDKTADLEKYANLQTIFVYKNQICANLFILPAISFVKAI